MTQRKLSALRAFARPRSIAPAMGPAADPDAESAGATRTLPRKKSEMRIRYQEQVGRRSALDERAHALAAVRASQVYRASNTAANIKRKHKGKRHHVKGKHPSSSRRHHHHHRHRHHGPPSQSTHRHLSRVPEATDGPSTEVAAPVDESQAQIGQRPSLARHRSATVRMSGDDAGKLSSRLQRSSRRRSTKTDTMAGPKSMSRNNKKRRRSVVGAGL